jgi:hypothetical protein
MLRSIISNVASKGHYLDAARGIVEGAVEDRGSAADCTLASQEREDIGDFPATVGRVVGVEEAVILLTVG